MGRVFFCDGSQLHIIEPAPCNRAATEYACVHVFIYVWMERWTHACMHARQAYWPHTHTHTHILCAWDLLSGYLYDEVVGVAFARTFHAPFFSTGSWRGRLAVMDLAFGKVCGVSIDTHLHRMLNQLGWVHSKTVWKLRSTGQATG